jgi:hypothetical protein
MNFKQVIIKPNNSLQKISQHSYKKKLKNRHDGC